MYFEDPVERAFVAIKFDLDDEFAGQKLAKETRAAVIYKANQLLTKYPVLNGMEIYEYIQQDPQLFEIRLRYKK